jgi:two-component system, NarL family, captular synthesis response regulator RcsB
MGMSYASDSRIRIALLDDHAIVRDGIAAQLSTKPDFRVVGSYASGSAMMTGLRHTPADVLLLDYSLGPSELDGVSLIRAVRSQFPKSRILILSSFYDPATVALTLRVGANGFVGKVQELVEIANAIRLVAAGYSYLSPEMTALLPESVIAKKRWVRHEAAEAVASEDLTEGAKLSTREREVMRCYLDGMSITQIAEKFDRSIKTISTQKNSAFRKLGVTTDNALFKLKTKLERS